MFSLPEYQYIAIEGNIGAGKTSLAQKLSMDFDAKIILEEFEQNSFLPRFYEDQRRYAFPLEMSFLASRYNQLKTKLVEGDMFQHYVISDYIFAKSLLFSRVNLDEDEYSLYTRLFEIINAQLKQPELIIYLHSPIAKLQWNIANRGRPYERNISDEYLQNLNEAYLQFIHSNKHMRIVMIDCSAIDFVNNNEHYQSILKLACAAYEPGIHYINNLIE